MQLVNFKQQLPASFRVNDGAGEWVARHSHRNRVTTTVTGVTDPTSAPSPISACPRARFAIPACLRVRAVSMMVQGMGRTPFPLDRVPTTVTGVTDSAPAPSPISARPRARFAIPACLRVRAVSMMVQGMGRTPFPLDRVPTTVTGVTDSAPAPSPISACPRARFAITAYR